ncbi:MAG: hypothetical protein DWQ10_08335 [Calditrichaeota bacterium]|nr:MAG: hypothetical protein DWQ10_08335 [Calditrichota bacterium]
MHKTFKLLFICTLLLISCNPSKSSSPFAHITPVNAHAHNDYVQKKPLWGALENGFMSIEVDVHLRAGRLCVAHDSIDVDTTKTLQSMYLQPIIDVLGNYRGPIYKNKRPVILLIDIKTGADSTFLQLQSVLKKYQDLFYRIEEDSTIFGSFRAIISGNRSQGILETTFFRIAAYDGRFADLDSTIPADRIQLISDRWISHFTWRGEGTMPVAEKEKLNEIIEKAHAAGRMVRFWGTDVLESESQIAIWTELRRAGVDLINTDKQEELREFLLSFR